MHSSVEADELVTEQFLRAELAELENRLTLRVGAELSAMTAILAALITLG